MADRRPRLLPGVAVGAAAVWLLAGAVLFMGSGRGSLAAVERICGAAAPDARFAPSPAEVQAFVADCGPAGVDAWRDLQLVDLVYPAAFAVALSVGLYWALGRLAPRGRALAALPLVAAAADYAENLGAWVLIGRAPEPVAWATWVVSSASAVKVVATTASWLLLLSLVAASAVRRWRRRRSPLAPA